MKDKVKSHLASHLTTLKQDPLAVGLIATTSLLMVTLFVWLNVSYDTLPDLLPLHFDAQGNADRIAERREIFVLPGIALVVALVNGVAGLLMHLRFGMIFAAYLLWSGALLTQVLIWIATWNITH